MNNIVEQYLKALEHGTPSMELTMAYRKYKCGGKTKKKEDGGEILEEKCGGKTKKKKITKAQEGIEFKVSPNGKTQQQRAQEAKQANAREAEISKQYFNSTPSIQNLARGVYHWWNSVPMLGGQDESGAIISTGIAPTPGFTKAKNAQEALNIVEKLKSGELYFQDVLRKAAELVKRPSKVIVTPTSSKGFIKGKEIIPAGSETVQQAGLSIRRAPEFRGKNPITNEAEAQAAKDFLLENGYKYKPLQTTGYKATSTVAQPKITINPKQTNKKYYSEIERKQALNEKSKRAYRTKLEDKKNGVKYRERKQGKVEQFHQTGDNRHLNNGYSRISRAKDEYDLGRMENYPEYAKKIRNLRKREVMIKDKGVDKVALKQVKSEIKTLLEDFRQKVGRK